MITYACIFSSQRMRPPAAESLAMDCTMRQPNPESLSAAASALVSRNITVGGHRTSVRLEPAMWTGLQEICRRERSSLHEICTLIAAQRAPESSLTAAIRVFIMAYFRAAATDDEHRRAGHDSGTAHGVLTALSGMKPLAPPDALHRN